MVDTIRDIMTTDPIALERDATAQQAARLMREQGVGDVLVCQNERLYGILTDRDLAIRGFGDGGDDPRQRPIGEICSTNPVTLSPGDDVERAMELMKENAVRRIPVVEDGRVVGIVSLGDLAIDRDPESCLGEISASPPNR